jgi:hypothetical protein
MPPEEAHEWHQNDGYEVSADRAFEIARILRQKLQSGEVEMQIDELKRQGRPFYLVEESARHFAAFCEESGGFQIW